MNIQASLLPLEWERIISVNLQAQNQIRSAGHPRLNSYLPEGESTSIETAAPVMVQGWPCALVNGLGCLVGTIEVWEAFMVPIRIVVQRTQILVQRSWFRGDSANIVFLIFDRMKLDSTRYG